MSLKNRQLMGSDLGFCGRIIKGDAGAVRGDPRSVNITGLGNAAEGRLGLAGHFRSIKKRLARCTREDLNK